LVASFAEDMSKEFEMSITGELQFFLGLQIKQAKEGTFVHQAKYTKDILKKFKMDNLKPLSTPMSTTTTLDADEDGEPVDQKELSVFWTGNLLRGVPAVDECGLAEIGNSKEETCGTQFRQVWAARCVIPYVLYAA
jgi:hypothetical protein